MMSNNGQEKKHSGWKRAEMLAAIISPAIVVVGLGISTWLTLNQQRQSTISNLKRELGSEDSAIRISAIPALADYPEESIPLLLLKLGKTVRTDFTDQPNKKIEDEDFTNSVKASLENIGKEVIIPLILFLRDRQEKIDAICSRFVDDNWDKMDPRQILDSGFYAQEIFLRNHHLAEDAITRYYLNDLSEIEGYNLVDVSNAINELRLIILEDLIANKNGLELLVNLLRKNEVYNLDLKGVSLSRRNTARLNNANLSGANLEGAYLECSNLENANLSGANLEGANLKNSSLENANLSGANLKHANLSETHLYNADLSNATLFGTDLQNLGLGWKTYNDSGLSGVKNLKGVNFFGVRNVMEDDLKNALEKGAIIKMSSVDEKKIEDMSGAYLKKVNFTGYSLQEVNLSNANLSGACLKDTDLQGIDLSGATLEGADLQGADLSRAILEGANLQNANLKNAVIQFANLKNAQVAGASFQNVNLRCVPVNGITGFMKISNFDGADLFAVTGLLDNQLKHALSNGALQSNDFTGDDWENKDLEGVNLRGANFKSTTLKNAYLKDADLRDANLQDTDMTEAYLSGARLEGADLRDADLTDVSNFREVKDFNGTKLWGVIGLSQDDLEYARSKGAIISEPNNEQDAVGE